MSKDEKKDNSKTALFGVIRKNIGISNTGNTKVNNQSPNKSINYSKREDKMSNFKTALHEIMGRNLSASNTDNTKVYKELPDKPIDSIESIKNQTDSDLNVNNAGFSIISEDTIVEGSIKSKSDLIVKGKVLGDIENEKNIIIYGHVEGNVISSNNVTLEGLIIGNLKSSGLLKLAKESKVIGDVDCLSLETNGIISGNINVKESVNIGPYSEIEGNVTAMTLTIKEGAKIKGSFDIASNLE